MSEEKEPLTRAVGAVAGWWRRLADPAAPGPLRADRARLRRVAVRRGEQGLVFDAEAAWACGAFENLWLRLHAPDGWRVDEEPLALIATLLARVREDAPGARNLGRHFARRDGDRPALSEERFRRLLKADALIDLHPPMARAIDALDAMPVMPLARLLLEWELPAQGPRARRRLAQDYWTETFGERAGSPTEQGEPA